MISRLQKGYAYNQSQIPRGINFAPSEKRKISYIDLFIVVYQTVDFESGTLTGIF